MMLRYLGERDAPLRSAPVDLSRLVDNKFTPQNEKLLYTRTPFTVYLRKVKYSGIENGSWIFCDQIFFTTVLYSLLFSWYFKYEI